MVISQASNAMAIVHSDSVLQVQPGTTPSYNENNPLIKLLNIMESMQFAAERECYLMDYTQYLIPFEHLELYGPSGSDCAILDPTQQDNKNDFQKQNVHDFTTTDAYLMRGWITTGNSTGRSCASLIAAALTPNSRRRRSISWGIAYKSGSKSAM